ncbi:MAG TPA: hypothetical protein VLX68_04335 [Chitinivibrionales bacterium]|nr:hypothetical protein [Chitinivibrionales bacterium]
MTFHKSFKTLSVAAAACGMFLSCTQFPTQLGYIGGQYVQTVGFVFTPLAEGAPGDTLHLHAYFAGEPVSSFACSLSTSYSITAFGSDTAVNFKPLVDPAARLTPDSIALSFTIPQDFFAAAGPVVVAALATIPNSVRAQFGLDSASLASVPPAQLASLAGSFLTTVDFSSADSTLSKQAEKLAELLSGQIVLHLAVNGGYTITRNVTVRYNAHVRNDKYVFVNKNPDPWWIGILKVRNRKRQLLSVFERDSTDTMFCLYARDTSAVAGPKRFTDTVLIDTGFTYYAAGDSGIAEGNDHRDSSYTNEGAFEPEIYSYLWFYQPDSGTTDLNPQNSLSIGNGRDYYSSMATPLDTAMHNFTLWARVSESASGVPNAPVSVSVKQVGVVLMYSEKYAASVKKK